jgi:D-lactate dehydrogenase
MILTLNRKVHRAYNRVLEGNFSLDGLLGFDLFGRTVGVIGTGKIGVVFAQIMHGFGCEVIAFDPFPNDEVAASGTRYVSLDELFSRSHIISLHCPLTKENYHLINDASLAEMQEGAVLVNTSRGGLIDTVALIAALKSGKLSAVGLDVYEEESDLFFEDLSNRILSDDVFTRLLTFPNVLVTGHQAFFTRNAMENIAATTMSNITEVERTGSCANTVTRAMVA